MAVDFEYGEYVIEVNGEKQFSELFYKRMKAYLEMMSKLVKPSEPDPSLFYMFDVTPSMVRELGIGYSTKDTDKKKRELAGAGVDMKKLSSTVEGKSETWSQCLLNLIEENGYTDPEFYQKADIAKQHFSKIRSDANYHPNKDTVIKAALTLRLSESEFKEFLELAGYSISPGNTSDIIVDFFFKEGIYDLDYLNMALEEWGASPIGVYKPRKTKKKDVDEISR